MSPSHSLVARHAICRTACYSIDSCGPSGYATRPVSLCGPRRWSSVLEDRREGGGLRVPLVDTIPHRRRQCGNISRLQEEARTLLLESHLRHLGNCCSCKSPGACPDKTASILSLSPVVLLEISPEARLSTIVLGLAP